MELSLDELLTTTPLMQARPEVLVPTDRRISWVHSSEIYDIEPLLAGGEVLLTTGLGLVGANDAALTRYTEAIAARGAAALVLELGRTFVRPPEALVDACARTGLGLVVLHAVVAFVRIARVANERILGHEAGGLRRADALARGLTDALLHRRGIQAMVATI
ncbi:MAG: PucR family transcriptional regulator ligand-binding domain-containing protein, partial [Nitriliruptoraceae bacterium]